MTWIPRQGARKSRATNPYRDIGPVREERKFLDRRSKVRRNGDVWLYGADMEKLRREVFERSGGRCEAEEHAQDCHLAADWYSGEMHHKVIKGMGGRSRNDVLENMVWLSKPCHWDIHGG